MQLRKIVKNRGHFPSDEAASKLLYLALRNIEKDWKWGQFTMAPLWCYRSRNIRTAYLIASISSSLARSPRNWNSRALNDRFTI